MNQNRNKLIDMFIANLANCVVHKILEKAIDDNTIKNHYDKELSVSFNTAMKYREKINPQTSLPEKDIPFIKEKIIRNARAELVQRIAKGYKNINLDLIEPITEEFLKEANVT